MTFQRRMVFGFALMALPVILIGAVAVRSNLLERRALEALGAGLTRTKTYAQVETAMFSQGEVLWQALSGMEPDARHEFRLQGEVVGYWFDRWTAELQPNERELADGVRRIQERINLLGDSVFTLIDAGRRQQAFDLTRQEFKLRLQPALTELNHEIYRRAREYSVQYAFARVQQVVDAERRALMAILLLAAVLAPVAAWLITRSLVRPIRRLGEAMALAGTGNLEPPIDVTSKDEIGDLARAFAQMTDRLRQSRNELVQSEKLASVGQMAAAVAHGLRNPLASLRASAQLALRHPDSPATREQLGEMITEVDRLDHRITHLLAFSRPAPSHPIRERVGPLIEGLLASRKPLLAERQVTVTLDLPPDLPEITVDPVRIEQALTEVVANALDALSPGGQIRIAAREAHDAEIGPRVVIEIADTGRGIPAQVLPSVFEPFFTTRAEGTGLGLAIARRFVEQSGGRLDIASCPGEGTTVRFDFPAATAAATTPGAE
jgi:signal transduction histidine kinase